MTSSYKPKKLGLFHNALVIHETGNFPIFYVECISERHLIVAGGGGLNNKGKPSKETPNLINILELDDHEDLCTANLVTSYGSPDVVMSGSLVRPHFVTDGKSLMVYSLNYNTAIKNFEISNPVEVSNIRMKRVKLSNEQILAGDFDGNLYSWKIKDNNWKLDRQSKSHTKEINEIDVDFVNSQIVTLSREAGECKIWDLKDFKLLDEFGKDFINKTDMKSKFNFRSCKYAYKSNEARKCDTPKSSPSDITKIFDPSNSHLLILCNSKDSCEIYKLKTTDLRSNFTSKNLTKEVVTSMAVSSDRYFAIGTLSGSVIIHRVADLKPIYNISKAHSSFVADLSFLPPKRESLSLTNSETCALISVSIDRKVVLHRPKRSSPLLDIIKTLFIGGLLYLILSFLYTNYHTR